MQDFRNLQVWEKAHLLTLAVYRGTKQLPREELFGLTSQMRRSSASIPTNIAEGCGRGSGKELKRFLEIAMGSASELEYQLLLARDLEYIAHEEYLPLHEATCEVKRMLAGFIARFRDSSSD